MSYTGQESLEVIVRELRAKLPDLRKLLASGVEVATLHGTVEMLTVLVERYERGEILERTQ